MSTEDTAAEKKATKESKDAEADLTIEEKAELAKGKEIAEKYKEEQENRADDDPLVLAQEAYAENTEAAAAADEERAKAAEEDDGA